MDHAVTATQKDTLRAFQMDANATVNAQADELLATVEKSSRTYEEIMAVKKTQNRMGTRNEEKIYIEGISGRSRKGSLPGN